MLECLQWASDSLNNLIFTFIRHMKKKITNVGGKGDSACCCLTGEGGIKDPRHSSKDTHMVGTIDSPTTFQLSFHRGHDRTYFSAMVQ